jgi:hypothetical protein
MRGHYAHRLIARLGRINEGKIIPNPDDPSNSFYNDIVFDFEGLVEHLLLFETLIIDSWYLIEVAHVIRTLGYEHALRLFSSGAVEVHYDTPRFINIGTERIADTYRVVEEEHDFDVLFDRHLRLFPHVCGCTESQVKRLAKVLRQIIRRLPDGAGALLRNQFSENIKVIEPTLKRILHEHSTARGHADIPEPGEFELQITYEHDEVYLETDLATLAKWEVDKLVNKTLLAMMASDARLLKMKTHNALDGVATYELPLFANRLELLDRKVGRSARSDALYRVLEIKGFPSVGQSWVERGLDFDRLMALRQSDELRLLRDWLLTTADFTDADLEEMLNGVRSRFKGFATGGIGKTLRWLMTTGAGLLPVVGPALGAATGALDMFLLDRYTARPGAVAFIDDMYPSLFKGY